MKAKVSKPYALCSYVASIARKVIKYIEEGEYRNAITSLEVLEDWAVKQQINESCEDPGLDFRELRDND